MSKRSGDAIEVTVTDADLVADLPLTAKTTLPADGQVVRFRQGRDALASSTVRRTFVLYRIALNGVAATLERGFNGRTRVNRSSLNSPAEHDDRALGSGTGRWHRL